MQSNITGLDTKHHNELAVGVKILFYIKLQKCIIPASLIPNISSNTIK